MPAKKSAPKPAAKARKADSRPAPAAARKVAATRKPAEKPKPTPAPKAKAVPVRKPGPSHAHGAPDGVRKAQSPATAVVIPQAKPVAPATATSHISLSQRIPTVQTEPDDNDIIEPGSLLAGPRNVQPYIVKRGEQYMSKEQSQHFRQILQSWKRDLMEEVDRTVTHMKDEAANFPDPNDRATQEEEFSLELRTRDRERKLIRKIEEAIKRIEDGSYGYCLETGEEIGIKRLEARPVATLSIEAQERRERRERQYGDRDDRYR